jgi:integrase
MMTMMTRRLRQRQNELKLRNGPHYQDHGLVFAKEDVDVRRPSDALGQPIQTLAQGRFRTLVTQAGVKKIKCHGLRHTCTTLLLAAGRPVHVVAGRLGHAKATMTLDVYAHAVDADQVACAETLSRALYGPRSSQNGSPWPSFVVSPRLVRWSIGRSFMRRTARNDARRERLIR